LNTPVAHTRTLIARKEAIEAELEGQIGILKANNSTLHSRLVDNEGFPRADLDIYAVRHARVRVIELRNDLSAVMDQIAKALGTVYAPASGTDSEPEQKLDVFAKVNAIAPGSPAASAGLQRDDLIEKFGPLTASSFATPSSLQPLADLVAANENRPITIRILRGSGQPIFLTLTPTQGWGGRGMLGCHIVPHSQ